MQFNHGREQRLGERSARVGISLRNASSTSAGIPQTTPVPVVSGLRSTKKRRTIQLGDSDTVGMIINGDHEAPTHLGENGAEGAEEIARQDRHPDFPITFNGRGVPKFTGPVRFNVMEGPINVIGDIIATGDMFASNLGGTIADALLKTGDQAASGTLGLTNVTNSTSTSTGALVVNGGVGIVKDLHVDGDIIIDGTRVTGGIVGNSFSTGILSGGLMAIASTTEISITDGTGLITDASDPLNVITTPVLWTGHTAVTITNPANLFSYIYIDTTGSVVQSLVEPTPLLRRDAIFLGKIFTTDGVIVSTINNRPESLSSPANKASDFFMAMGPIVVSGLRIGANGTNLSIDRTSGILHQEGINWHTNAQQPSIKDYTVDTLSSFAMSTQLVFGALVTVIDSANYDVGGVITAIPGSSSRATNMRVYFFNSGFITVQYGQDWYVNLAAAEAALIRESFITQPLSISNGVLLGVISVISGATDLSDLSHAAFFAASKFGEVAVGVGGTVTANMQNTYDNSVQPQIIVDSTSGAIQIQDAAVTIAAPLFEVLDNTSTAVLSVGPLTWGTGTWTPTMTGYTLSTASAQYVRQGPILNFTIDLAWTAKPGTAVAVEILGMPFTSPSGQIQQIVHLTQIQSGSTTGVADGAYFYGRINAGDSKIGMLERTVISGSTANAVVNNDNLINNKFMRWQGTIVID